MTLILFVLASLVLHEAAHAQAARALGDPTACLLGRGSLLPWRHIDGVGSLLAPLATWILVGIPLGWCRAVPVDAVRLGRTRFVRVLLAGPAVHAALATLALAAGWRAGALAQALLSCLNLLPIGSLDGGRIWRAVRA